MFVDKSLKQMLKEIEFKNPIIIKDKWAYVSFTIHDKVDSKKSYVIKGKDLRDNDSSGIWEKVAMRVADLFGFRPWERVMPCLGDVSELVTNVFDWGKGIREMNIYYAPGGMVIELIQKRGWEKGRGKKP